MSHFQIKRKKTVIVLSTILFSVLLILSTFLYIKRQKPPEISDIATIEFYSHDGTKFFELNNQKNQTYVPLEQISPNMVQAIISVEDQHFYTHHGFDYRRIVKSLFDNMASMKKKYGASTITQQYARNLYLNHEKSYKRKIKEAYFTVLLENSYSKQEIIEGYLNTIYFGHGIYGVADASEFYFNTPIQNISLAQGAVLAAIPKAPTYYSPLANFEKNKLRKELIIEIMYKNQLITTKEYEAALAEPITIIGKYPRNEHNVAPYFQDILLNELEKYDLVQDDLYKGIKVFSTLDLRLNTIAMDSIQSIYNPQSNVETALFAIEPNTGYVKTVIGGRNYKNSQYNRALSGQRHPGSTIKPFLYFSALEYGFTPTTTFMSSPTTFYINHEKYAPSNFANKYANREITMAYALAVSDNIYAVKTHLFLGENTLVTIAHRLGITAEMKAVPSLALGSTEIKLSEMATAYAHFANLGKKVRPVYITKITDINNRLLYEYKPKDEQLLNPNLCFIMNHLLTGMFDPKMSLHTSVTGLSIAYQLKHLYAGKSGSTDYDSTMIGYNPNLVLGVWTGYDDSLPLTDYTELNSSKQVWANVMENYFLGQSTPWYEPTKNVVGIYVNPVTGELPNKNKDQYLKKMYYMKGTEPTHI